MMPQWFILDHMHQAIKASMKEWAVWSSQDGGDVRRVAFTDIGNGVSISTVFLGLNHNFGAGDPILFETMVFADLQLNDFHMKETTRRYATWAEAQLGHNEVVALVRRAMFKIVNKED